MRGCSSSRPTSPASRSSRGAVGRLQDGRGFSCGVVILATGSHFETLGLPAEKRLRGRGVIDCTPCDVGFYVGKPVVVVGSGDYAVRDALQLANIGASVTLLSQDAATVVPTQGITVVHGARVASIVGDERVEAIIATTPQGELQLAAAGIAVRIALEPNTEWLADLLDLDPERRSRWAIRSKRMRAAYSPSVICAPVRPFQ